MKAKEYKRMLAVVLSAGMMAVQPASVMAEWGLPRRHPLGQPIQA